MRNRKHSEAQAINFTPDLIEAIASKVAEKISERAVREIASEVTPEMVELIIKQMAEEKIKNNHKKLNNKWLVFAAQMKTNHFCFRIFKVNVKLEF